MLQEILPWKPIIFGVVPVKCLNFPETGEIRLALTRSIRF